MSETCPLSSWSGDPTRCGWCDQPARMPSPWCSVACEDAWFTNHDWERARAAALVRDGDRCTDCGVGPGQPALGRIVLRALIPMGPVDAARLWVQVDWMAFELACSVEAEHRQWTPQGYRSGCHHHLDGLVTRCRSCVDRAVATQPRRAG